MKAEEKKYLRMSPNERVQHFFLLTSFITLIITGFWLKFPEAWWVRWLSVIFGKYALDVRANTHRVAAVAMIVASVYHLFYIAFSVRGRQLVKDFWLKKEDALDMWNSLLYLVGRSKEKPRFGRFSYIEKMEYWAVVWGTVVMGATGEVLWFENIFLSIISPEGMYIATTMHYYEAILASLAILVWHFYFIFVNPDIKGMNKAWVTGYLSEEEMEEEHPLELEEIEKQNAEHAKEFKDNRETISEKVSQELSVEETGLAWTKTEVKKSEVKKIDAAKAEETEEKLPVDGVSNKSEGKDVLKKENPVDAGDKTELPLSAGSEVHKDKL